MSNKLFQKAGYIGIGVACAYIERWYSLGKLKKREIKDGRKAYERAFKNAYKIAFKDGYYIGFNQCKKHISIDVKYMIKQLPDMTWDDQDLIMNTIDKINDDICWEMMIQHLPPDSLIMYTLDNVNGDICWDTLIKSKTDS